MLFAFFLEDRYRGEYDPAERFFFLSVDSSQVVDFDFEK